MTVNAGGQMKPRGGEVVAEKEVVANEGEEVVAEIKPADYSCEVLLEKTTKDKAEDKKFPSDAYIVKYNFESKECIDVTRSAKPSNIFDLYYDKYGKGALQAIEWGYGTVNPTQYGYKQPEKKKRRRKDG
tara:strand:- start:692 stop:1081 length:390 start_codon:yes stop_codon:yes gene_type:complete